MNNRKKKVIAAYELDLRLGWEGAAADGTLVLDTSSGRVHVTSGSLTHPADIWRGE